MSFLSKTELAALATGSVETADIADGALSADVAGRAKMADGFFTNAEIAKFADDLFAADAASRAKFADDLWDNSVVAKFADGLFAADAASRAKFVDGIFENVKLATPDGRTIIAVPVSLADLQVGGSEIATDILPGFAGTIEKIFFVTGTPGAGAGATFAISVEIGAVAVTGGVLTVTLAATATLGGLIEATAVTATNVFTDTDTLSIINAAGTVFTSGAGVIIIVCSVAGQ